MDMTTICSTILLASSLVANFSNPPHKAKPWCYWWWQNGNADRQSITADLEAMRNLGFGGCLMSDARGYWDDDDHVRTPKPKMEVMSPEWRELIQHSIRECRRLGLEIAFNTATCGGALKGPWKVGRDAPKRLMCRIYEHPAKFESPDLPFWQEVASCDLFAGDLTELVKKGWFEAGDGTRTQFAGVANKTGGKKWIACSDKAQAGKGLTRKYTLRFGATVIPGHEYDVDILDPQAIRRHFNRFTGAIMDEAGQDMVGLGKTVTHIYSVSWEGLVPQWSVSFKDDFKKFTGLNISEHLHILAGLCPDGTDPEKFMQLYRKARNDMFRENFYGTLAQIAKERGCGMFSENGGPWHRDPELFEQADQLAFLSINIMPQGEFWVKEQGQSHEIFKIGDMMEYIFVRGPVSAGHVYGKKRISMESFTHMTRHWSMSPSKLKIAADKVFADGVNHIVWHTFSLCPDELGVPGFEYFAGTHINKNVTWHRHAKAFIDYLARCEAMMQAGEPVVDIPVRGGSLPYAHWGRMRERTPDGAAVPAGYNYDIVNDSMWDAVRGRYPATLPPHPDLEGPFAFAHRRTDTEDIYFLQGFAKARTVFRVAGKCPALFDAVTGEISGLEYQNTPDGRTAVELDLSRSGSAIIVFSSSERFPVKERAKRISVPLTGPWDVSFAYHRLTHERQLPSPVKTDRLFEWTESENPAMKYFSGTAVYRTAVDLDSAFTGEGEHTVSIGELASGLAKVRVNGKDCATVWCAPWTAAVPAGTLRPGANEIEIEYINNWVNRLIGDCFLSPEERVTASCLKYVKGPRCANGKTLNSYSGYCTEDELQRSGLLGPVTIERRTAQNAD